MAEYYKHEIAKWNVATDDLTLEQEAAYHRVVAMIRLYERPFRHNLRVLSGLWRCNERRAKRLLDELIEAGKLTIEGGFIIDDWVEASRQDPRPGIPAAIRETVWQRDGEVCRYCSTVSGPFHLDHVAPWSRGGLHSAENLVVACARCNWAKSDRTPSEMGWSL